MSNTDYPSDEEYLRGAGDIVARAAKLLGIKECDACRRRRAKLNEVLPFNRDKEKIK